MLYKIINTYADESDFILNLIDDHPYIGWYMLLRLGESDTTKATLTRRECIEIIRKDGKYSLQGTTQGRYLTGGVPPVRFSM